MSLLEVKSLSQAYGGSRILRDVSFTAEAGQVVVLLGRNGVGKSTLLRTLMGVHPALSGQVTLDGKSLDGLSPHLRAAAGIGYVPQGREIFPRLSVEENLRVGFATGRLRAIEPQIYELFPVLAEMRSRRGGDLSGGQQQQLAIARALCTQPKMLLLEQYYDFAAELADAYLVMERGEIVARGAGAQMQADGVRQMVSV